MAAGCTTPPLGDPARHPYLSESICPNCHAGPARLAIGTDYFLYLRCEICSHVWTQPERRAYKRLDRIDL